MLFIQQDLIHYKSKQVRLEICLVLLNSWVLLINMVGAVLKLFFWILIIRRFLKIMGSGQFQSYNRLLKILWERVHLRCVYILIEEHGERSGLLQETIVTALIECPFVFLRDHGGRVLLLSMLLLMGIRSVLISGQFFTGRQEEIRG